jgi:2-dehydropantoate 2-reductase
MTTPAPYSGSRIAVVGPGALGTLFAARLALAGIPTLLLDYRLDRALRLNEQGLRLLAQERETLVRVPVTADPHNLARVDAALVLVKAYQTEQAAAMLAEHLRPDAIAVTLQNGLGNLETLTLALGEARAFGGTTAQGALLEAPGIVRDTGQGPAVIGHAGGEADHRLDGVAQALLLAGFSVTITQDIQAAIWTKAILNAAINPVAALTRQRNGPLAAHEPSLALMTAVAREAFQIARKHGIALEEQDWRARLQTICAATTLNVNSMLRDVLLARRTEVDAINGAIVRTGELHDTPATVNRSLWYLIRTIETSYETQVTG